MSSHLMRILPGHCFDVHILRTFKEKLVSQLKVLNERHGPSYASGPIQEVIIALDESMGDIEMAWLEWRHERVVEILKSGFHYAKKRVRAAVWRREQGRPPTCFLVYDQSHEPLEYRRSRAVGRGQDPYWSQASTSRITHSDVTARAAAYDHSEGYPAVAGAITVEGPCTLMAGQGHVPQVPSTSLGGNQPGMQTVPVHAHPGAAPLGRPPSPQNYHWPMSPRGNDPARHYPPPPYPPPNYHRRDHRPPLVTPQPHIPTSPLSVGAQMPGSPVVSRKVAAAEVAATSFLEAVQKALSICIELGGA
ncbi:hypothetical protein BC834DRAFT_468541 [Gloeopeniophorella convolvens]|nr:hypothetical protein BC834DRAFT_468541 [Gloeopeniophorella convolvens]